MNEHNHDKLDESQIIETSESYQEINKLLSKFKRYNQLPEDKQKKVISVFLNELQKVEQEEQFRIAIETCEKEGHVYLGEYEGWKDNSFCRITPYMKIRSVNSLIETSREEPIHIRWRRICDRCGETESLHKIPDIVSETEQLKNKTKKKQQRR